LSDIHKAFVYPNIHNDSIYLTFYDKNTFKAFDSIYLFKYPYYQQIFVQNLQVIDKNRFAILITNGLSDFYIYIIESEITGIEEVQKKTIKLKYSQIRLLAN
jgi:hypothetical protein